MDGGDADSANADGGDMNSAMNAWDPALYTRFADHRDRPFHDLVARVGPLPPHPPRIADLGCGPGTLTRTLLHRWPDADVIGVDSSPQMIEAAKTSAESNPPAGQLAFVHQDLRDWAAHAAAASHDLIVSNAALHWVPDHLQLLPAVVDVLAPGGWLAIQIPGNFEAPLHTILRELATSSPYAEFAGDAVGGFTAPDAADYLAALHGLGCAVDAWETTYLQVLHGRDPVFEWISGTGARPVLHSLPARLREDFEREYRARLRAAYPPADHGTVLPFRRIFATARKAHGGMP